MKEKVVELLIYIMNEIHDNKRVNEIDIADLKSRGYTQAEISAAFSWLYDNFHLNDVSVKRSSTSIEGSRRMLHEAEKFVISTDGYGYLIHLCELGLLNNMDLENVIERAMMAGFEKLSAVELQSIVASILFAKGGEGGTNRYMLNSGDTIH